MLVQAQSRRDADYQTSFGLDALSGFIGQTGTGTCDADAVCMRDLLTELVGMLAVYVRTITSCGSPHPDLKF